MNAKAVNTNILVYVLIPKQEILQLSRLHGYRKKNIPQLFAFSCSMCSCSDFPPFLLLISTTAVMLLLSCALVATLYQLLLNNALQVLFFVFCCFFCSYIQTAFEATA